MECSLGRGRSRSRSRKSGRVFHPAAARAAPLGLFTDGKEPTWRTRATATLEENAKLLVLRLASEYPL